MQLAGASGRRHCLWHGLGEYSHSPCRGEGAGLGGH